MITLKADNQPIPIKTFRFSGGERQVRIETDITRADTVELTANIWSSDDLMDTVLMADAVVHQFMPEQFKLVCPYLPYARQDRVCTPGEANALNMVSAILDTCHFDQIEVWDVHNLHATVDYLPNLVNKPAADFVQRIPNARNMVLVAPDKGAFPRVVECALRLENRMICAEKTRNPATGELATPTIPYNHAKSLYGDENLLIVDDICDGGRTFINLASVLRPLTTGKIYLYVTHGIFSQGFAPFAKLIDHIYVANLHPHVILSGMDYLVRHVKEN